MAINFIGAPIGDPNGSFRDILSNYMKGYQFAEMPEQIQRQRLGEEYANTIQGAKAQHAPEMERFAMMLKKAQAENAEPLAKLKLQQEQAHLTERLAHADYMKAQARNAGMTTTERELMTAFGGDRKAVKDALKNQYGIATDSKGNISSEFGEQPIGVPYATMGTNERLHATKQMDKDLNMAEGMKQSLSILDEMDKLYDSHPDLADSFTAALYDPTEKGIKSYLTRKVMSKKEQAALDKFGKLTGDLVLKGGEALGGGRNFTDARQSLVESVKPTAGLTREGGKYVINHLRGQMAEGPEWAKALRYGKNNKIYVTRDPDRFKQGYLVSRQKSESPVEQFTKELQASGQKIRGIMNGKTFFIPKEMAKSFLQSGGEIIE